MTKNSKVIYYDCANYFFEIDNQDNLRKYGASKEHRSNLFGVWNYLWMVMVFLFRLICL